MRVCHYLTPALLLLAGCGAKRDGVSADRLLADIKTLASDEFEGRAPGSAGEQKTVDYLTAQFKAAGLEPGNPDGTYFQNVPLIGTVTRTALTLSGGKSPVKFEQGADFIARCRRMGASVEVPASEIVFVGYGVVAPEYQWDDYKGVDVKGKVLLMLINDPPVRDPKDLSRLDDTVFRGKAMTYYGRWTYKFDIAREKGAAAVMIVHETGPAGYPFESLSTSWVQELFDIQSKDGGAAVVPLEGWFTEPKARELLRAGGKEFDDLKQAAVSRDFKPVPLGVKLAAKMALTQRAVQSKNVVAKLAGSDAGRKNEYVIYSAHWDHMGRDTALPGDQIYNGAVDNAGGVATMLEIARSLAREKPRRSVLFLAETAEEKGLLGSRYYAENPLYPLKDTVAVINIDGFNTWGRTKDYQLIGKGLSTLDEIFEEEARKQDRVVKPDAFPEKGYYYRSDHFEFAKLGVPGSHTWSGIDYIGKPEGFGKEKEEEYTAKHYHKVSDDVKPDWDLSGTVEDVKLLFQVGVRVANMDGTPQWKPGAEFQRKASK